MSIVADCVSTCCGEAPKLSEIIAGSSGSAQGPSKDAQATQIVQGHSTNELPKSLIFDDLDFSAHFFDP